MYDLLLVIVFALNIFLPTFIGIRDRSNTDRTLRRTGGRPERPRRDSRAQRRRMPAEPMPTANPLKQYLTV